MRAMVVGRVLRLVGLDLRRIERKEIHCCFFEAWLALFLDMINLMLKTHTTSAGT